MLQVGSLFSGVGGMDEGLEDAGMRVVWQVEKDAWRRDKLRERFSDTTIYKDCATFRPRDAESVDLICGGFPCQPHSTAGKRQGADDERDGWRHFARIVGEAKPRWVLAENVPSIVATDRGRYFGRILSDLAAFGYDATWDVLSARAFGSPQSRERLVLVAHTDGQRLSRCFDAPVSRVERFAWTEGIGSVEELPRRSEIPQPLLRRYAHGDQRRWIAALGDAVVPAVAEWIGRRIIAAETTQLFEVSE
ncbi:MAG: DNA (cytosine-5-)-methyltransferase [Candidatus Poribacteria bacterium]|nr:DNA (cytosine-5-)-methyltransferase [Candidatus Poribacteria bacterium]